MLIPILMGASALLLAALQTPSPSPTPAPTPGPKPSPTASPSATPTPSARPPAPDPATIQNADHASQPPERNPDNSAADTRDDQPPKPHG